MKSWQRRAGGVLLVIAGVVIYQSVHVLRLFDAGQPGSGFMPFGLGVVLAVLSVLLIAANLGRDTVTVRFWTPHAWMRPLLALVLMALFVLAFDWLGAVVAVGVLVAVWLLVLERKRVLVALLTAVTTSVVVYLLFEVGLKAPFPRGSLFGG